MQVKIIFYSWSVAEFLVHNLWCNVHINVCSMHMMYVCRCVCVQSTFCCQHAPRTHACENCVHNCDVTFQKQLAYTQFCQCHHFVNATNLSHRFDMRIWPREWTLFLGPDWHIQCIYHNYSETKHEQTHVGRITPLIIHHYCMCTAHLHVSRHVHARLHTRTHQCVQIVREHSYGNRGYIKVCTHPKLPKISS